jgi:hypothetical protein
VGGWGDRHTGAGATKWQPRTAWHCHFLTGSHTRHQPPNAVPQIWARAAHLSFRLKFVSALTRPAALLLLLLLLPARLLLLPSPAAGAANTTT